MAQSGKEGFRPNLPVDVLTYWQALLRQEEALAVRPKARRAPSRRSASPVGSPTAGQDYTKLLFDGNEQFLLLKAERLQVAMSPELSDFFEDWLSKHYRSGGDDGRLEYLVSFPTLLLPRDELAGLLRFSVATQWKSGGEGFAPPTPKQRAQGQLPAPPERLDLLGGGLTGEDALPYFVDTRLLRDVLRVELERLDAFFASVRERSHSAPEFVAAMCELLASQLREDGEAPDACQAAAESPPSAPSPNSILDGSDQADFKKLLSRLHALTAQRLKSLSSRARAFPVALLLDASRNRTTFHVQRDLQAGLTGFEQGQFLPADPIATYLSGQVPIAQAGSVRRELVVGRFRGAPLTHSQRTAAELFWGSKFTAVQGPPGTGKTHLILNLAASQLVQNFSPLQRIKQPRPDILLVTSTNNRAVDNVVRPLGQELPPSELPWALRVGSRDVIEKVTQAELLRAKSWLERQPEVTEGELKRALHDFTEAEQRASMRLSALKAEFDAQNRISELQQALAAMPAALPAAATDAVAESLRQVGLALASAEMGSLDELLQCLSELAQRLRTLSELAEASQSTSPKHLALHYKVTRDRQISRLEKLLGQPLELDLPPPLDQKTPADEAREAWEDAAERALWLVLALKETLEGPAKQQRQLAERERLTQELSLLVSEQSAASEQPERNQVDWAESDREQAELLEAAVRLREVWARENKKALVAALGHAAQACARVRSLRSVLEASKGPGVWLRRLYPIWGCTLLSIGNNFSPERDLIRRVVIDEAGQCHGAYAASALIRAESALIIGDVHQLEPVVELSQADESRVLRNLKLKSSIRELGPFRVYQGSDTSAQSIADRAVALRPTLSDHFRCQPEIAALCDELCGYGLVTHTPQASHRLLVPELCHSLLFSDVAGSQERFSGSWVNQAELVSVTQWVHRLLRAGLLPEQIGVITPFRGQLERLWRELRAAKIPLERPAVSEDLEQLNLLGSGNSGVAVGTVHRFQGGERSVILFSTTITQARSLPFVDERPNLINVAASRAKEHLITVGHASTLSAGKYTQVLVQRAKPAFVGG